MARHFVIEAKTWNTDLHVLIGVDPKRWERFFKAHHVEQANREHFHERMAECTGAQLMYENQKMWNLYAYFPAAPKHTDAGDLGAVTHEMLHATVAVMRRKGVTLCNESEEAFTYLTEFFVREFWWRLNGKR